jgi:hypothetical protein
MEDSLAAFADMLDDDTDEVIIVFSSCFSLCSRLLGSTVLHVMSRRIACVRLFLSVAAAMFFLFLSV